MVLRKPVSAALIVINVNICYYYNSLSFCHANVIIALVTRGNLFF